MRLQRTPDVDAVIVTLGAIAHPDFVGRPGGWSIRRARPRGIQITAAAVDRVPVLSPGLPHKADRDRDRRPACGP